MLGQTNPLAKSVLAVSQSTHLASGAVRLSPFLSRNARVLRAAGRHRSVYPHFPFRSRAQCLPSSPGPGCGESRFCDSQPARPQGLEAKFRAPPAHRTAGETKTGRKSSRGSGASSRAIYFFLFFHCLLRFARSAVSWVT